ncbi:MAG: hypothetical protein Q8L68_06870 [Methylococcales bacterium]|nr:hypothetical protein [Methylococcales bacterium]
MPSETRVSYEQLPQGFIYDTVIQEGNKHGMFKHRQTLLKMVADRMSKNLVTAYHEHKNRCHRELNYFDYSMIGQHSAGADLPIRYAQSLSGLLRKYENDDFPMSDYNMFLSDMGRKLASINPSEVQEWRNHRLSVCLKTLSLSIVGVLVGFGVFSRGQAVQSNPKQQQNLMKG